MFPVHSLASAPEASQSLLAGAERKFGFVPNLLGEFAEAPAALEAYLGISQAFERSSLSPAEQQIVLLATSVANQCRYCVAAHSMLLSMRGLARDQVEAVRRNCPLADTRLEALRTLVHHVVTARGWAAPGQLAAFRDAGFSSAQYLEVLTGITQKTLSNYLNHVAATPLDAPFAPFAWEPEA